MRSTVFTKSRHRMPATAGGRAEPGGAWVREALAEARVAVTIQNHLDRLVQPAEAVTCDSVVRQFRPGPFPRGPWTGGLARSRRPRALPAPARDRHGRHGHGGAGPGPRARAP